MISEMEIDLHAKTATGAYALAKPQYEKLSEVVKSILVASLPSTLAYHSIQQRAKDAESFSKKIRKIEVSKDGDTELKYPGDVFPIYDESKKSFEFKRKITDLAGVRVITYFPKHIEEIKEAISREFAISEERDVGEERFVQGKFGYQSIHYLVSLKPERFSLSEYKPCKGLIAEIQVRTILQHAWAEMEHDIAYKSEDQIPAKLNRRFVALAGMLEIADKEFQSIQDEDATIRNSVVTQLQDESIVASYGEHSQIVPDNSAKNTKQKPGDALIDLPNAMPSNQAGKVKDLVKAGRYREALQQYDQLIHISPKMYSLYFGRAKARFLDGDRKGAISDLDLARKGMPNAPALSALRELIDEGTITNERHSSDPKELAHEANKLLADGNGEEAFALYSKAQIAGFTFVFAAYDKAMARILIKDTDGAEFYLSQISKIPGSPMETSILGLKAIISSISKTNAKAALEELKSSVQSNPDFSFNRSPLFFLEKGFLARDTKLTVHLSEIFRVLKKS